MIEIVLSALIYTRENRDSFSGYINLRDIGTPSLITHHRGFGGLLRDLLIG